MIESLKKFNILILIGLFIILYQPPILSFNLMHCVGVVSLVYLMLKRKNKLRLVSETTAKLVSCYIFLFLWLFFTVTINEQSLTQAVYPLYFIIDVIPFVCAVILFCRARHIELIDLLDLFVFVALLQAILSILALFIPNIQKTFVDLLIDYGYEKTYLELASFRMYGLSSGLTFATPIIQAVAAIICITSSSKNRILRVIVFIILSLSAIINARVSIIVLIVGMVLYVFFANIRFGSRIKYVLGLVTIIFFFFYLVLPFLMKEYPATYVWLVDGLNDIYSLFGGEKVSYSYFEYLADRQRFALPSNILSLLFGKGSAIMGGKFGVASDIGYINDIWLGGVCYSLFNYCTYGYIIKKIIKKEVYYKYLGQFFAILCVILNIKGSIMSNNALTFFIIIIYMFSVYDDEEIIF